MKKLVTLLVAVSCFLSCIAITLTPQAALHRVADSPLAAKTINGQHNMPKLVMTGETSEGNAAYYIFTNSSGTLFVSADDIVKPLLGYSDAGNFEPNQMPPQLKWWLGEYTREIEWAARHLEENTVLIDPRPKTVSPKALHAISPMLTTVWNQTQPFNKYCPVYNGVQTVTGCVATSMAQVMNYHKWPQNTVASISYKWNGQTLTSPEVILDWDNMLDSYNGIYNTTQANAVARLMQVAGYSISMDYNTSSNGGSGAFSQDVRGALIEKFGYDVGIDFALRDYYSYEEWKQMIYDNLVNVGPVIYDGIGTNGGHSFVCDGFDGNDSFHFNWGWGGMSDGYFVLSALNPGDLGTGGGAGGFNYDQSAILGIQLPQSNSTPPVPYIGCNTELLGSVSNRTLTIEATDGGGYYNFGVESGYFAFGVRLENTSTGEMRYYTSFTSNLDANYGVTQYSVQIPSTLNNGIYEVRPSYKVNSGDWQLIRFPENNTSSIFLTVSSDGLAISNSSGEIILESWNSPTGFVVGKPYQGYLTVSSTYYTPQEYSLDAYLCVISNNQYSIVEELGNSNVTIPANSTADMEYSGTLSSRLSPGSYYLVFAQDYSVVGSLGVEVTSSGAFVFERFNLMPEILVQGENSTVDAIISSTFSTSESIELSLYLCTLADNQLYIDHSYGAETITVRPGSSQTISYSTIIPKSLPDGTYYLVLAYSDNTIFAYDEVMVDSSMSGVESIRSDQTSNATYYNIHGIKVSSDHLAPGIYIRYDGHNPRKTLIR